MKNELRETRQINLTGVVQAGGQSQRMGQDKALMRFLGEPLILRPLRILGTLTPQIIVVTNNPDAYRFIEHPLIADILPGMGALGGLYTALRAAETPLVVSVACDMPFVNPRLLKQQCDLLANDQSLALAIPESARGLEPMHVVYRTELCLEPVRSALEKGDRRMISWHDQVNRCVINKGEIAALDPSGRAFQNLNTPEEFQRAEAFTHGLLFD